MSTTPETDAVERNYATATASVIGRVTSTFARSLETRLTAAQAEIDRLKQDVDEYHALTTRQSDLLSAAAIAIHGPEPELTKWSHHDIAERITAEIDRLTKELQKAKAATTSLQRQLNELEDEVINGDSDA